MSSAPQTPVPERPPKPLAIRVALAIAGSMSLGLGVLGIFLPVLPTTPFVLLAAGCYARAWPAAHRWIRASKTFGPICRSGQEGRYLPPRAKTIAIVLTLISFGASIACTAAPWWLRAVLVLICIVVVTWLARLPTQPRVVPQRVPVPD